MNRMYHIKKYIEDRLLFAGDGRRAVSIESIINLFLQYLDENKIVYGEGEFHRLGNDLHTIIDEKI